MPSVAGDSLGDLYWRALHPSPPLMQRGLYWRALHPSPPLMQRGLYWREAAARRERPPA
eukprot:gene1816-22386_t